MRGDSRDGIFRMDKLAVMSEVKELTAHAEALLLSMEQHYIAKDDMKAVVYGVLGMSKSLMVITEAVLATNEMQAKLLAVQEKQLALMQAG